ncbi:sodium-coupled monocarboxylate transporter 1 [Stomoxys calcitrans]|uniref:sodium-coupled monocarboxylate transporter 1 n=1 Tax=Stomoxys calcitrans TaxID=35570 RepID=UPI0027E3426A|nr:sodium-coupled monocarboxylate transporter 1 [Stomoxys calcitrans]XP_013099177.2 sodium-coupled monocarboxylate transporter 1 [Stomoxys calcitrans]XP_013099178.2 sodium-coupled monocarboxylate transporter 1 [Stomoxys calcitrans]XP_013099179.2 sodium-coupled monocarboxylate transporter 1 [Stomoxys calcitrans]XP_013099180.2 sodium-coupled monocarboxylate transporter 1 [Stomoxys calcitrans]XP_013099181.2 sodium-coupled monocarboxylate transporter 1 [Stomoxys calcitrans]XP_059219415.1 sodium-c
MTDVDYIISQLQHFTWPDYVVFVAMFILCIFIGIYFGFMEKSSGESDYLMGGRNMLCLPIALSLVASFISGITLLGLPTEIYSYGIQYLYVSLGVITMGFVMAIYYLPVFHDLNITSTYEYLESRFDRRLRMFGSVMFTIMNIGYLPIVIYVPALAFNQVTGVAVHTITPIVCIICIFYTTLGGLKAVVWTDVVQIISMVGALILVAVKGSIDIGGASKVFENAWESGRIEGPDMSVNPTVRHTLWSQLIGGVFYWTQTNAVSQNMIQRYLALPTLASARKALALFCLGVLTLMGLCSYNGLLMYATYKQCDPLTTKLAKARDQLLPLFVMETLGEYPGLTGLFIAGVFSAALSSLSTCLNSMSAVVLEDFVKPFVKRPLSETAINWIMRSVVVSMGTLCVFLVYIVEHMGTVLQLTMSLEAITNGPLLGIFTIGVFMPWINGNSALIGGIVGVIGMSWVSLKAQWAVASGAMVYETKPLTVEHCDYKFDAASLVSAANSTISAQDSEEIFPLYRISYMWYTCLGACLTMTIAIGWHFIFGGNNPKAVDQTLLSPCIRKYFRSDESHLQTKDTKKDIPLKNKRSDDEEAL